MCDGFGACWVTSIPDKRHWVLNLAVFGGEESMYSRTPEPEDLHARCLAQSVSKPQSTEREAPPLSLRNESCVPSIPEGIALQHTACFCGSLALVQQTSQNFKHFSLSVIGGRTRSVISNMCFNGCLFCKQESAKATPTTKRALISA